jgi:hypothetical protein
MARITTVIDCPNFKNRVAEKPDQREKLGVCHEVWSIMHGMQEGAGDLDRTNSGLRYYKSIGLTLFPTPFSDVTRKYPALASELGDSLHHRRSAGPALSEFRQPTLELGILGRQIVGISKLL